ncbi:hypothetical protein V2O64_25450 (plasmid) [Verrucomicrobiaceae bacterium 227]
MCGSQYAVLRGPVSSRLAGNLFFQIKIPIFTLLLIVPAFADVVPGASSSSVNYHAYAASGPVTAEGSDTAAGTLLENGTFGLEYLNQFTLSGSGELSNFSGEFDVFLYNNQRINEVSPAFVTLKGLSQSVLSASGEGTHEDEENYTQTLTSQTPGNQSLFEFEVTTDNTPMKMVVSTSGFINTSSFILQKLEGGIWNAVVYEGNFISNVSINRRILLGTGLYRTFAVISTALAKPEGTVTYELEIGDAPGSINLPPEGNYTAPGVANLAKNSSKPQVISPAIAVGNRSRKWTHEIGRLRESAEQLALPVGAGGAHHSRPCD